MSQYTESCFTDDTKLYQGNSVTNTQELAPPLVTNIDITYESRLIWKYSRPAAKLRGSRWRPKTTISKSTYVLYKWNK